MLQIKCLLLSSSLMFTRTSRAPSSLSTNLATSTSQGDSKSYMACVPSSTAAHLAVSISLESTLTIAGIVCFQRPSSKISSWPMFLAAMIKSLSIMLTVICILNLNLQLINSRLSASQAASRTISSAATKRF